MLIAQGPLRISLFGGGSDLPAFLERNEGAVLSFAIDKRVYVVGHPFTHRNGILLKYSKTEDVQDPEQLQHPIARVVLKRYGLNDMDIAVMSDVPAGTGMGSSSSFTVAFLAFVRRVRGMTTSNVQLAREACEIEVHVLSEPIGFQDQWASALGGINVLRFKGPEGHQVAVEQISIAPLARHMLEENLYLIPVGEPRSASKLLAEQSYNLAKESKVERITRHIIDLVDQGRRALMSNIDDLGPLLHETWALKREVSKGASTGQVDDLYERAIAAGATGGKLLGAGGSGYMAIYVPASSAERFTSMFGTGLPFRISDKGAGVIYES